MDSKEIAAYCPFEERLVPLQKIEGDYRACFRSVLCGQHALRVYAARSPGDLIMQRTVVATEYTGTHPGVSEKVRACRCGSHVVGRRWSFARVDDDK